MDSKKRDKYGTLLAFVMGLLFNVLGVIFMVWRELRQSKKGGFPIETDDVVRYSLVSSLGAVLNAVLIVLLLK